MNFLLFWIFEFNIIANCDPSRQELDDSLWTKLKTYQNKTAISDEKMMNILKKLLNTKDGFSQEFHFSQCSRKISFSKSVYINLFLEEMPKFRLVT